MRLCTKDGPITLLMHDENHLTSSASSQLEIFTACSRCPVCRGLWTSAGFYLIPLWIIMSEFPIYAAHPGTWPKCNRQKRGSSACRAPPSAATYPSCFVSGSPARQCSSLWLLTNIHHVRFRQHQRSPESAPLAFRVRYWLGRRTGTWTCFSSLYMPDGDGGESL